MAQQMIPSAKGAMALAALESRYLLVAARQMAA